jgi:hypothetical protein
MDADYFVTPARDRPTVWFNPWTTDCKTLLVLMNSLTVHETGPASGCRNRAVALAWQRVLLLTPRLVYTIRRPAPVAAGVS